MSVTGAIFPMSRASPRPSDLPLHLEVFSGFASAVGDSGGGTVSVSIGLPSEREWYVAMTSLRMRTAAAMLTSLEAPLTDWSDLSDDRIRNGTAPLAANGKMLDEIIQPNNPIYLGRVTVGSSGEFRCIFATNTDLVDYAVAARGYLSEKPFMIPLTFSF